ncbi:MAG: hypothetical protein JWM38_1114 [Sphingomonas bacterium]|nr:hypothetical protein [Sphingomonas bacterium]
MAFSNDLRDRLYGLLPAVIRETDKTGELRALLAIIDRQADLIEDDIRQLYENAFIETCEPWVVPYIGDLVGTTPLFDESRVQDVDTAGELFRTLTGPSLKPLIALRGRADVARTIYYRRRKGTLPMLEELARDVTGWSAHAVEFFELVGWTQWLRNHLRPHALRTPDLRSVERMDRLDGAFDEILHTVDVRPPGQDEGWHNVPSIGFFLWRLGAHPLERVAARRLGAAGDFRYHFSPLGNDAPLFSRARREGDEASLATELHVPQPIRPARFFGHIEDFYGPFGALTGDQASVMVVVDGVAVPAGRVVCRNLSTWSAPSADRIAIDPVRGRLALGPDLVPAASVEVAYHYGFPADLGGGPYRRRAWLTSPTFTDNIQILVVDGSGAPGSFPTIVAARDQWAFDGKRNAIIRIRDSRTYAEALTLDLSAVSSDPGTSLAIEAADGVRPHMLLEGPLTVTGERPDFALTLGGVLIEGRIEIAGSLHRLRLLHTTLVPGETIAEQDPPPVPAAPVPSITAVATLPTGAPANTELGVELAFAICGPIGLAGSAEALVALDSIIDGVGSDAVAGIDGPTALGPAARFERSTLRGRTRVRQIDFATEVIFDGLVTAERVQTGCVRFSFVPAGSRTPRRYRCQPDLAERRALAVEEERAGPLTPTQRNAVRSAARRRVRPEYTSEVYGQPAYLQLALTGPAELAQGAADGSEMGAYCHLKQPQREANLRVRLSEYLPFGLDYGLVRVT